MTHNLFGKLKYKDGDESWAGSAQLPLFAAIGMLPEPTPMTEEEAAAESERMAAELNAAMENMRQMMRERFGEQAVAAFEAVDRAADEQAQREAENPEPPDPKEEERERRREEKRTKHRAILAKGKFPLRIAAPGEAEPTTAQVASYRFLLENEQTVYGAVVAQVWESFQSAFADDRWRQITGMQPAASAADIAGRFAVTRLDISHGARGGFAHLIFLVDSNWQDEHGLVVVYSPDTRDATWTTWDGLYDLLESDEPQEPGEEYVPTPHDELLEAILTGNEERARELVAAGADINALGPDEYPPLWISVDQMEVEEVRRLLAFGADPALANPDENTTPLKHARRMYRDMGFAPSKKRDEVMDGVLSMMRDALSSQMTEIKTRMETIIKLLEDATAK